MRAREPYGSADEVRRWNAVLDADLAALCQRIPERHLHDEFSDHGRTLAQQLGHLAEFHAYFATQLDDWLGRERLVAGRVADNADLEDALLRATVTRLDPLLRDVRASVQALADVLDRLADGHLTATIYDIVQGREPLTAFLDRYVIAHKARHAHELAATITGL